MSVTAKNKTYTGSDQKQATVTLAEEYEFFLKMAQVVEGMVKTRETELKPFGITPIQAGLMYVVKTANGMLTASEIARRLLRQPASIYQLLDRMEDQGLVKCMRNTEGKREVRVKMTEKGEEAYRKQGKRHVIPKIIGQLSPKERDQLNVILEKLRVAIYTELAPKPLAE
jgi:MarR family multiple antibiotic resistance transcriptional regulator